MRPLLLPALSLLAIDPRSAGVPARQTTTVVATASDRVVIPAGPFLMGSTPDELRAAATLCAGEHRAAGALLLELATRCSGRFDAETPQMKVMLPAFAIDRTEVTVASYRECSRLGPCEPTPIIALLGARAEAARHPVERVTWQEATIYCRWRGGRLPSESEWEKAARGIGGRPWPWGARWEGNRANHGRLETLSREREDEDGLDGSDGSEGPAPVGSYRAGASPYGVLDAAGNVWEWTAGTFAREPPQMATRIAPRGPSHGDERTLRGGSYRSPSYDLRAARRIGLRPEERALTVGFRCAYDLK